MKRLASACPLVIRRFASIWSTAAPTERSALRIINSGLSEISARDGSGGLGEALAEQLSRQTGIAYVPAFTAYPVTGQLVDWVVPVRSASM